MQQPIVQQGKAKENREFALQQRGGAPRVLLPKRSSWSMRVVKHRRLMLRQRAVARASRWRVAARTVYLLPGDIACIWPPAAIRRVKT
jgi:hypothetical protein